MTSESKILTVSYGTFSCTLEGFDDPFDTMKAIAEYFRDLAAEDRYFGAEPPQPDAAMLHRIAEREVSRLVDAKVRDTGVTLRPRPEPEAEGPKARITGRPRLPQEGAAPAPAAKVAELAAVSAEPALQEIIPSGVAAKLARIRQSVDPRSITAPMAEEALAPFVAAGDDIEAVDLTADLAADAGSDILGRLGTLLHAPDEGTTGQATEEPAGQAAGNASSVDSWLVETDEALLLSDVSDAVQSADLPDVEPVATPAVTPSASDETGIAASLSEEPAEGPAGTVAEAGSIVEDILPEDSPETPATLDVALLEDPLAEAMADGTAPGTDDVPAQSTDLAQTITATEEAPALSQAAAVGEDTGLGSSAEPDETEASPDQDVAHAGAKQAGKARRVNSRVVRIHPGDEASEEASATRTVKPDGEDAEVARLLRQADDVMAEEGNRRRLDSIAHMKAAVAATEADRAATGKPPKPDVETRLDPYRDVLAQVVQPDPEPSAADTTNVKPRRKTVSVRPQETRPGTIRPGMVSPPPLVLVSEQRIDRIDAPPATPAPVPGAQPAADAQPGAGARSGRLTGAIGVGAAMSGTVMPQQKVVLEQPARTGTTDFDDEEDLDEDLPEVHEAGLASFADMVGVKSMTDMLEAAAAYATCVEKREQFTRPQLMRRLMASAGGKPVSREEGLRSFGTLLRTGRIEKVSRGQYALAEHSPYLTEARRLA
ncbi:hypothetical protein [Tabrizicola caldifontis]|uniref:hypothetical protein n=1 Tax=Tabrizicola caldifontis TaxID=2528036 RepID=UPI00197F2467|nr:hypothetical protein [Rhodobacter sp. YIM 73028]